jgi:alpha-D-ribose 1-methylphosphonate 5-triphosphate diphosphatase PhnM
MQVSFDGHMPAQRQVTLTQNQLYQLFEAMKSMALTHIQYSSVYDKKPSYVSEDDQSIYDLCEAHGIDVAYSKDRFGFFQAIIEKLENPYQ